MFRQIISPGLDQPIENLAVSSPQINGTAVVGAPGAYSTAAWAPLGDITSLVLNDLSAAFSRMNGSIPMASDANLGLSTSYTYAGMATGAGSPVSCLYR